MCKWLGGHLQVGCRKHHRAAFVHATGLLPFGCTAG